MDLDIKRILSDLSDHVAKSLPLKKRVLIALLRIFIPFGIGISVFLGFFLFDQKLAQHLAEMFVAYTVPFIGPLAAPAAGINAGVNPLIIIFWLTVVEVCGALLVWYNYVYMEKIPKIGQLLHRAEQASYNYIKDHHWIHKIAIVGLIVFIMIPIQGAGPLTAPILGRVMGMDVKEVLTAVIIAAVLRFGILVGGFNFIIA